MADDVKEIMARTQELIDGGLDPVEAMEQARNEVRGAPNEQTVFEIRIELKPRVAGLVHEFFGGHATHKIEDRLAAYVVTLLTRSLIGAQKDLRPQSEIVQGRAVTVSPSKIEQAKATS